MATIKPNSKTQFVDPERMVKMLKALGNPVRFQMMETLAERQTCITGEIVETTALAQSTVSQHLKVLREAGLIAGEVEGPATCYCINVEGVRWLKDSLRTIDNWLPEYSPTNPSMQYFQTVAEQWDSLRAGYFSEGVRQAAIRKAFLRQEMEVADVGAGTGFMSAGLAPLVRKVYALDGSPAMLDVARSNLRQYSNIDYQVADGLSLPLPDESLDAVFANMFLHHCPDPLKAIEEMTRLLRPGGRLVITDMDSHPYGWLKEEMADIWQGFERDQMCQWFTQAGLVNLIVGASGEACCAESNCASTCAGQAQAQVGIFLAVGTRRQGGMRQAVQSSYAAAAQGNPSCCSPQVEINAAGGCCSSEPGGLISADDLAVGGYSPGLLAEIPAEAAGFSLGCGNPLAIANLRPGEYVLDIGSGGGLDALLAARQVGVDGRVIGVDMTPQMIERASRAALKGGFTQVEFRLGAAENLPLPDCSVDVVISNCVINLVEDKGLALCEAFRVLKAGGRLEISDVVSDRQMPLSLQADRGGWAECVSGALPEEEYLDLVRQAGFREVKTQRGSGGELQDVQVYSLSVSALR